MLTDIDMEPDMASCRVQNRPMSTDEAENFAYCAVKRTELPIRYPIKKTRSAMNRKGAVGMAVLATLLITPAVLAKNNTCTVIGIEKEQVVLRCSTT